MWSRLSNANTSNGQYFQAGFEGVRGFSPPAFVFVAVVLGGVLGRAVLAQTSSPAPQPIPLVQSPEQAANVILQQAIIKSVWGPPAYCVVRQSVHAFGNELNGVGEFVRGGLGSGKLKFSLRMPAADQLNTLLQVSDGGRMLTVEAIGDINRRTEVDLGKVRSPSRLVLTSESLSDPIVAMYLAIGGQAEALRKIYQQYRWVSVREGQIGATEVWFLSGRIPPEPRIVRSQAEVDNQLFAENNSGLLPTKIEVAIGKPQSPLAFWLYQVEQTRAADEPSAIDRGSSVRIVTEWSNPRLLATEQLAADLFELPTSNEPLLDETHRYLPPSTGIATLPAPQTNR